MTQAKRWKELIAPGIVALVGAGGKTTVLSKLVEYGGLAGQPMVVTTTTKLYESQVAGWQPYYGHDFNAGEEHMLKAINRGRVGAWFGGVEGTKVVSLAAKQIDEMHRVHPNWQIVVEADGAKEKWLKAPKQTEPVIPSFTRCTIGIINLQILGKPLTEEFVHHVGIASTVMDCPEGHTIKPVHLARLITHHEGLYQYSRGEKILFGTGYDTVEHELVEELLRELEAVKLRKIFLADGYKASLEIRRILCWQ